MTAAEIRKAFLDFFASKGHSIVPSAPLVIKNDPTLMFTNSGMNQFKDYFLGNKPAVNKRVADTQKCLRVSGKHNDLEEVGIDTYHHTMFEMLGNWSFGDYFKKDALEWSWELLTEVYKLPKDRLYVTVFEGDAKENLAFDQEAYDIWKGLIAEDHILMGNKKDNFWEMGDTGPCGPCSEIHIDLRTEAEIAAKPGKELVNDSHPQVIEIWNNVFMEFNRKADSSLEKLPNQHVDTGMGFERLCMAMQGKTSNYDTDVFQPLIQFISKTANKPYEQSDSQTDIAMRVLADHIRAVAFTIADGQLPSNNKAGYVIRRILRRAVRYYYNFLGFREPFMYKMVAILSEQFRSVFPELAAQQAFVEKVILEEESSFLRTLETGLKRLEVAFEGGITTIDGKVAFELSDTFGFPLDLTALIARERGIAVDEEGFHKAMEAQKNRSRKATELEVGDWIVLVPNEKITFVGYDVLEAETRITRYRKVLNKGVEQYQIVLETTPFYAESGGQTGDKGTITIPGTEVVLTITDTKKENDLIIHIAEEDDAESILASMQGTVKASVNRESRTSTSRNHSATHLLHSALRNTLGTHVQQKGSLVTPEVLRFDFSHFSKIEDADLQTIEMEVNQKIRENIALQEDRNVPIAEAREKGAMALFGEKYGDAVRVITFDPTYSVELCGGTHVPATGIIGQFVITSETSSAAGVRRVEALTGKAAEAYFRNQSEELNQVKELLKNPREVVKSVQQLLDDKAQLQKQLEALQLKALQAVKSELLASKIEKDGIAYIAAEVEASHAEAIKQLAYDLRHSLDKAFIVLGANFDGKPHLAVMITDNLVEEKKLNAAQIVKDLAKHIQGGGGGQPFFATAGGKNADGMQQAIQAAKNIVL
jgi:alanyl-tRNA synthetase